MNILVVSKAYFFGNKLEVLPVHIEKCTTVTFPVALYSELT